MPRTRTQAPETTDDIEDVSPPKGRRHVATYTRIRGEPFKWFIRNVGPDAEKFSGRDLPVTTKSGEEHTEKVTKMIYNGIDKATGKNMAIYEFVAKPRDAAELNDEIPF
jgi:hypothetical protein